MRRAAAISVALVVVSSVFSPKAIGETPPMQEFDYGDAIDAISFAVPSAQSIGTLQVLTDNRWVTMENDVSVENEQDPNLTESKLYMLPKGTHSVRVMGINQPLVAHPIRVSDAPLHYDTAAARGQFDAPMILSRADWGADESLRVRNSSPPSNSSSTSSAVSNSSAPTDSHDADGKGEVVSGREQDCLDAQRNYPQEFKTTPKKITTSDDGKTLLWPESYSPQVKMLVVHHTAMKVAGDDRSGAERMRAIYQYHAVNRGWGDIGYNYVIDDQGQIYEGRAGGDYVVAGHAYCHNVGTVGISLMGNFDVEEPPQAQLQALQHLLKYLGSKYNIDLGGTTTFHGQTLPTIVGHRDLLDTDCPGYYTYGVLDQVRANAAGNPDTVVRLLPPPDIVVKKPSVKPTPKPSAPSPAQLVSAIGSTSLSGRPGSEVTFAIRLQANTKPLAQRSSAGALTRSDSTLAVWVEDGVSKMRLRDKLLVPTFIRAGEFKIARIRVKLPAKEGNYTLALGPVTYNFSAGGRRIRDPQTISTNRPISRATPTIGSDVSLTNFIVPKASAQAPRPSDIEARTAASNPAIRIRLGYQVDTQNASITIPSGTTLNGSDVTGDVFVRANGSDCEAWMNNKLVTSGVIRIDPGSDILTVASWTRAQNQFRGVIECRVLDGNLVLINELPLESYMAGIGEEGDGEPYEKQRAFAIAARTYAAWYLDPDHRKFPDKPYDGSDSPAEFQLYTGYVTEKKNPNWVMAVKNTAGLVLKYSGSIIKPPYFSSDDGHTRSPSEAGLGSNFPFASIFQSKPDPWCQGMKLAGHGVGMSGCGAEGQANDGKTAEEILQYYYPGTKIVDE